MKIDRYGVEKEIENLHHGYRRKHNHSSDILIYVDAFTYEYLMLLDNYDGSKKTAIEIKELFEPNNTLEFRGCEVRPLEIFEKVILIQRKDTVGVIEDTKYNYARHRERMTKRIRELMDKTRY